MFNGKTVAAVILAAGSSRRMGLNLNKVYIKTGKMPIIEYSLTALIKHDLVDEIVIAVREDDYDYIKQNVLIKHKTDKPINIIIGGNLRSDSVYNSIKDIDSDIVIIQDGARPLIRERYITDCIAAMEDFCGAVTAVLNKDNLCVVDNNGMICDIPNQNRLYKAQTPQCFHTAVLRKCYNLHIDKSIATDDSFLLEKAGYDVKIILGDKSNIKITTPFDLVTAGNYL